MVPILHLCYVVMPQCMELAKLRLLEVCTRTEKESEGFFFINPTIKIRRVSLFQIFYVPLCVTEISKLSLTLKILAVDGILGKTPRGWGSLALLGHTQNSILFTAIHMLKCTTL